MIHDCPHCDGFWMLTDAGMRRCPHCTRGRDLRAADRLRTHPPAVRVDPVLGKGAAEVAVAAMGVIAFFPSDPSVRSMIRDELRNLCTSPADAAWLSDRMVRLYRRWPGVMELRLVYVSRKPPHDGLMPIGTSDAYPDGIPSEHLEPPPMLALPPGATVSAVPELDAAVLETALAKSVQKALFRERPAIPARVITQADIDAAKELNRQRQLATVTEEAE